MEDQIILTQKKRLKLFPWIDTVYKNFSKSFPSDYDVDDLNFFHGKIEKELECVSVHTLKRTKALFATLGDFYNHFCWKIKWKEHSPHMKASCAKVLSVLSKVGLILSRGNLKSNWLNQTLSAVNVFPGNSDLLYDALLHINKLKRKYQAAYGVILKNILYSGYLKVEEPTTYFKLMFLLRRLKLLQKNSHERTETVSLATRVDAPSSLRPWLISHNLKALCEIKIKEIGQQLMQNAFSKDILRKIREIILPDMCFEKKTELLEESTSVEDVPDQFFIDNEFTAGHLSCDENVNAHSTPSSCKKRKLKKSGLSSTNMESELFDLGKNVHTHQKSKRKTSIGNTETNDHSVPVKKKRLDETNKTHEGQYNNFTEEIISKNNKAQKKINKKFGQNAWDIEYAQPNDCSDNAKSQNCIESSSEIKTDDLLNAYKKIKKRGTDTTRFVSQNEDNLSFNEILRPEINKSKKDKLNFSTEITPNVIDSLSPKKRKKKKVKVINETQEDLLSQSNIQSLHSEKQVNFKEDPSDLFCIDTTPSAKKSYTCKKSKKKKQNSSLTEAEYNLGGNYNLNNDVKVAEKGFFLQSDRKCEIETDNIHLATQSESSDLIESNHFDIKKTKKQKKNHKQTVDLTEDDEVELKYVCKTQSESSDLIENNHFDIKKTKKQKKIHKQTVDLTEDDEVESKYVCKTQSESSDLIESNHFNIKKTKKQKKIHKQPVDEEEDPEEDKVESKYVIMKDDESSANVSISKKSSKRKTKKNTEDIPSKINYFDDLEPNGKISDASEESCHLTVETLKKCSTIDKMAEKIQNIAAETLQKCNAIAEMEEENHNLTPEAIKISVTDADHLYTVADIKDSDSGAVSNANKESQILEPDSKSEKSDILSMDKEKVKIYSPVKPTKENDHFETAHGSLNNTSEENESVNSVDTGEHMDKVEVCEISCLSVPEISKSNLSSLCTVTEENRNDLPSSSIEIVNDQLNLIECLEDNIVETSETLPITEQAPTFEEKQIESFVAESCVDKTNYLSALNLKSLNEKAIEDTLIQQKSVDSINLAREARNSTEIKVSPLKNHQSPQEIIEIQTNETQDSSELVASIEIKDNSDCNTSQIDFCIENYSNTEAKLGQYFEKPKSTIEHLSPNKKEFDSEASFKTVNYVSSEETKTQSLEAILEPGSTSKENDTSISIDKGEYKVSSPVNTIQENDNLKISPDSLGITSVGNESMNPVNTCEHMDEVTVHEISYSSAEGIFETDVSCLHTIAKENGTDLPSSSTETDEDQHNVSGNFENNKLKTSEILPIIERTSAFEEKQIECSETDSFECKTKNFSFVKAEVLNEKIIEEVSIQQESDGSVSTATEASRNSSESKASPQNEHQSLQEIVEIQGTYEKTQASSDVRTNVENSECNASQIHCIENCLNTESKKVLDEDDKTVEDITASKENMIFQSEETVKKSQTDCETLTESISQSSADKKHSEEVDCFTSLNSFVISKDIDASSQNIASDMNIIAVSSEENSSKNEILNENEELIQSKKPFSLIEENSECNISKDFITDNVTEDSRKKSETVESIAEALYKKVLKAKEERQLQKTVDCVSKKSAYEILTEDTVSYVMEKIIKKVELVDYLNKGSSFEDLKCIVKTGVKFSPEKSSSLKIGNISNVKPFGFSEGKTGCLSFSDVSLEKVNSLQENQNLEKCQPNDNSTDENADFSYYRNQFIDIADDKSESISSDIVSTDKLGETICNSDESNYSDSEDETMDINDSISDSLVCNKTIVDEEITDRNSKIYSVVENFHNNESNNQNDSKNNEYRNKVNELNKDISPNSDPETKNCRPLVTENSSTENISNICAVGSSSDTEKLVILLQKMPLATVNIGIRCDDGEYINQNNYVSKEIQNTPSEATNKKSIEEKLTESDTKSDVCKESDEEFVLNQIIDKVTDNLLEAKESDSLCEKIDKNSEEPSINMKLRKRNIQTTEAEKSKKIIDNYKTPERSSRMSLKRKPSSTQKTLQNSELKSITPPKNQSVRRSSKRLKKDINMNLGYDFNQLSLNSPKVKILDTMPYDDEGFSKSCVAPLKENSKVERRATRSSSSMAVMDSKDCLNVKVELDAIPLNKNHTEADSNGSVELIKEDSKIRKRITRSSSIAIMDTKPSLNSNTDLVPMPINENDADADNEDTDAHSNGSVDSLKENSRTGRRSTSCTMDSNDCSDSKAEEAIAAGYNLRLRSKKPLIRPGKLNVLKKIEENQS